MKINLLFKIAILLTMSLKLQAQVHIPGYVFNLIDNPLDTTSISLHPSIQSDYDRKAFEIINPYLATTFNSEYPRGFNDGAIWNGRGLTFELHAGITGRVGKLSYTFFPNVFISQNRDFRLADQRATNLLNYQFSIGGIDWVQQYGSGSFIMLHPGQSEIRLDINKFNVSLSTQNYSFGPSRYNPIIMSPQGGGFPHIKLGTKPITFWKAGEVEVNALAGFLSESDYFDNDNENDNRYFNGLFVGYSPSFLKNLKVGISKVLYKQTQYFEPEDLFSLIYIFEEDGRELNTGNDSFDQMASAFMEWSFEEVGFKAYAEFAKNDFNGRSRANFVEPEHTRAYTIGFQKDLQLKSERMMSLVYEHTNLSRNHASLWRPTPPYYAHGVNRQGYTNNGQIIGAGIGPGGNSDNLSIIIKKKNLDQFGFLIQRIENNRDYFVVNIQNSGKHDIEYSFGVMLVKQLNNLMLNSEFIVSHNYNTYYTFDRTNFSLNLGVRF